MSLAGWDSAKKYSFTISSADVPSDEVDFPNLLNLSSASGLSALDITAIFTELGASSLKFAVEDGDTGNQCYVEVERWDNVNLSAQLWVKIPSLSSTVDTVINFYYDSLQADNTTYVGATTTVPAQNVWNSGIVAIYHMSQDPSGVAPQILDSTANANHGTTYGTMVNADLVDGLVGKAISFDGVDDYIDLPYQAAYVFGTNDCCILFNFNNAGPLGNYPAIISTSAGWNAGAFGIRHDNINYNNKVGIHFYPGDPLFSSTDLFADNTWYSTAVSRASSGFTLYIDGINEGTGTSTDSLDLTYGGSTMIGGSFDGTAGAWHGIINNIQIYNVAPSAGWIAVTNLSNRDQLGTWLFASTVTVDLIATNITTGSPLISNSIIGQVHKLITNNILTGSPLISNPVVTSGIIYNFAGLDILTGTPLISQSIIGQVHKLLTNDILIGSPLISNPTVTIYIIPPEYVLSDLIFEKSAINLIFEKSAINLIFEKET